MKKQWADANELAKLNPKKGLNTNGLRKPKFKEMDVKNRHAALADDDDDDDEEEISTINAVMDDIVEVTIDSGASRSVWPMAKRGVRRSPLKKKVKLAAANGTEIAVKGEAELEFEQGGKRCRMGFLDADVKRPLASVSAIVDQGNTVVFGPTASYVEQAATGERIPMVRRKGVFVLELKAVNDRKEKFKRNTGGAMDIEEVEEDNGEEMEERLELVEQVGGLWFRKPRGDECQGFTRQA